MTCKPVLGLGALLLAGALMLPFGVAGQATPIHPKLADQRLQITLYAEHPDIVTPIGAAVDPRGRLLVTPMKRRAFARAARAAEAPLASNRQAH